MSDGAHESKGGAERGGPFFSRGLATLTAVLSLFASIFGAFSAWQAEQAKRQAQETQAAFERSRLTKDYQIKVFEMVDKSLAAEGGLIMASAYASSLEDARLQASLADAIRVVARSRQTAGKLTPEEAEAFQILVAATRQAAKETVQEDADVPQTTKVAAGVVSPLSDVGVTSGRLNAQPVNPIGWDVDVFWCESRGQASRQLANAVAADLAGRADARSAINGAQLGRIRVRTLRDQTARAGKLATSRNEVRADAGEEALADSLAGLASGKSPGAPFSRAASGAATKWYLSLFACGV